MANGETKSVSGMTIEAVPMYNVRPDPQFNAIFHAKGRGNGYVVTIVYPYHYYESDPKEFETALKGSGIEVRIRNWY